MQEAAGDSEWMGRADGGGGGVVGFGVSSRAQRANEAGRSPAGGRPEAGVLEAIGTRTRSTNPPARRGPSSSLRLSTQDSTLMAPPGSATSCRGSASCSPTVCVCVRAPRLTETSAGNGNGNARAMGGARRAEGDGRGGSRAIHGHDSTAYVNPQPWMHPAMHPHATSTCAYTLLT